MGRIAQTFERLKAAGEVGLIPFITAGDPDLQITEKLLLTLADAGADIVELGVPFSDPMADGPTIQLASERALSAGTTLQGILDMVSRVRNRIRIPVVLMGYFNPVFRFGCERFAHAAAGAGVDGVLLVDLPAEQRDEIHPYLRSAGVDFIQLIAPTTPPARLATLAAQGEGFLYFVSMTGVTGAQQADPQAIAPLVEHLRTLSPVPVAVGFGINTPAAAAAVGQSADAVVVGSALVKVIAEYSTSPDLYERVDTFVRTLKQALPVRG
ncbi:tryptophan synthase, alpha chain [Geoalkalibacter ferrihydriticus]|uniref:Tryptophan synthase alpha chain n=2 Tax=Geoalkalibacter ferrihydriticus TaxID=392333 RepID=A0A0C2HWD9_9BACT|nr:tryptophan synthase subunit alpha [Geoalkalibacter ferrihydriticus]KIH77107.1 tryptophan synthase subunit alpha [Geoalkalibacter ferrihydriticus DSM 17813]SDL34044.1 tryptophan synthase, alpha chain [Geoalkalibacter ferrihydriticus]